MCSRTAEHRAVRSTTTFPQGRAQLLDEAVALAGEFITALIKQVAQSQHPVEAVDDFFTGFLGGCPVLRGGEEVKLWRQQLLDSDFRAGCPVVAVATNDDAPQLARSAAVVFTH